MNYYERCVKRIENAKEILVEHRSSISTSYTIDDDLYLLLIAYRPEIDRETHYGISFKKIPVPIEIELKKQLFDLAQLKMEDLEAKRHEEILKDL